jgi:hypothetical protein
MSFELRVSGFKLKKILGQPSAMGSSKPATLKFSKGFPFNLTVNGSHDNYLLILQRHFFRHSFYVESQVSLGWGHNKINRELSPEG